MTKLTPTQKIQEEELLMGFKNTYIPSYMHAAIYDYVIYHRKPGDFLISVLENNLVEAVNRADDFNRAALQAWVRLIYNCIPGNSWGSPEIVKEWLNEKDTDNS